MKTYLKFAAGFWMRAFLTMGSLAGPQGLSGPKKNTAANAAPVPLL